MNKNLFTIVLLIFTINIINSQINSPSALSPTITGTHAFVDASDYGMNWASNESKGLIFPQTDLTKWVFNFDVLDGFKFTTAYDGMVVYNVATGSTLVAASGNNGVVTSVTPGYYYFSNPGKSTDVTSGIWMPLGNNATKNINTLNEVATSISVDGAIVYAIKGTFITDGTTAITTIVPPTGITGVYRITIYKTEVSAYSATAGNLITRKLASEVYDFNLSLQVNNVVTGKNPFTEVYPVGTYNYTLEYFK